MKTWPLRWRIAIWSAFATALALVTFIAVVAANLYSEQVELIDARMLASERLLRPEPGDSEVINREAFEALTKAPKSRGDAPLAGFALVRTKDGAVIQCAPKDMAEAAGVRPAKTKPFTFSVDGESLRFASFPRGDRTLLLAASLEPAEDSVRDLLRSAAIALPLVLLVVAGGSWWIARHALQPIARIAEATALITADRLGDRLPAPATADEIGRLTEVLNGMFDRLQRSFGQATRFTADAAHELRTPLTIMRCQVEDGLRSAATTPATEPLLVGLLEEITGLQKISDNLLLLARFDTGKNPLERAPLDFSALLEEAAEDAELLAAPKALKVVAEIAPGVRVDGDAVMLRRVLLNLIDNAVKFSRAGGELKLTLRSEGGEVVVIVGNTGPGIPEGQRAGLFERFYRSEADRNRGSGGSGLGLSLCREIMGAHGGRIGLEHSDPQWTEFGFRLPRLG
jgi:signal transduction histidine kinase